MAFEEKEPLSSNEDNNTKVVSLERVIQECGSFGRYQYKHFFFLALFPIVAGVFNFYYVFGAAETPYLCVVPEDIRQRSEIEILPSQCLFIVKGSPNETDHTYPCTKWTYDQSTLGKTFTEEANFVCQHRINRSLVATMLQIGGMISFFTGQISDLIGRRQLLRLLVTLLLTVSLSTQMLLQFVPMSINQKFILLLIGQFFSGIDTFMVTLLLLMEITTSSYATFAGNLALVAFGAGEIVVAIMAYACRHWLRLKWVMTMNVLIITPYLFFVPESPHWLLTKRRYEELKELLHEMAQCNGRSDSQWLPFYRHIVDNHQKQKNLHQHKNVQLSFCAKLRRFITHVPTMSKLLISGYLGFITLLLYFQISYALGAMDEINPYLNIIIGALVEATGYIVPSLLMIRFNRKPMFILFLILTVICLLLTPLVHNQNRFIVILVAQLGKFAISGAGGITYVYVPELFPTSIRGSGMGFFVFMGRLGSTIAPIVDASISHNQSLVTYMYYVYTVLTIVCVVLTLLLPETRNVPLVDKIDYTNSKNKKKSSNTRPITRT